MNYPFGYRLPTLVGQYKQMRCVTLWAGGLGVIQSIIMMGLTLTGILAYNCIVPAPIGATYGTMVPYTFYVLYFKGDGCKPDNFLEYNITILTEVPTVQEPWQILIWECVYLGLATLWLISSVLLLTRVKKENTIDNVVNISGWVTLTLCISLIDLTLAIIFGIDYGNFHSAASNYNFSALNGAVDINAVQLLAASVVAISMVIVSLKGFILWLINVGLLIYLMIQSIALSTQKDSNETLFMPRQESDDILTTQHPPIIAYEEKPNAIAAMAYTNDAYVMDNNHNSTGVELNQEAIVRAARISTDVQMNERRFRNLDTFQQYPPPPQYSQNRAEPVIAPNTNTSTFPAPDYSPPMQRSNLKYQ